MICCEDKAKTKDMKKFKKVCKKALKELGKKNFALIIHGNSFPSLHGKNTGFGTPNSEAGKNLMDFASGLFNAIQLGPQGKTKACDSSPYTGTIFSINPLFIDLEQLTTKEWGNILSEETYNKICNENPNKDIIFNPLSQNIHQNNQLLPHGMPPIRTLMPRQPSRPPPRKTHNIRR